MSALASRTATKVSTSQFREHPEDTCFRFTGAIRWEARRRAEAWCRQRGFSYGPMVRGQPSGLMRGDWTVPSWGGLSDDEKQRLDGAITSSSFEMGPVLIRIRKRAANLKVLCAG